MRVLILGGDGYLGWPTAMYLSARGHDVAIVDNMARRGYDNELGTESLVPIPSLQERVAIWEALTGRKIVAHIGDICDYTFFDRWYRISSPMRLSTMVSSGPRPIR